MSRGTTLALAALLCAVALLLGLFLPGLIRAIDRPRLATVDLVGIVSKQQEATLQALNSAGADEDKRRAALKAAEAFGAKVNEHARSLAADCKCVLVVKQAVVAGEAEDLTALLVRRMTAQQ